MNSKKMPRTCFKYVPTTSGATRDVLRNVLADHLRSKFGAVKLTIGKFPPADAFVFKLTGRLFLAVLSRSRFDREEWTIAVDPMDPPVWLGRSRHFVVNDYTRDLLLICEGIHCLLGVTPGISVIRWYFERWRYQSEAVWTPSELQWD